MAETRKAAPASTVTGLLVWADLKPEDIALLTASAKGWKPEPGDEIRGRVLAVKIGSSDVGVKQGEPLKEYPILFVMRDGATLDDFAVAVHAFHSILRNELMSQRPEFGDAVYIKALGDLGREAAKGMNAPEVYAVHVSKPSGAPAASPWDLLSKTP